MRWRIATLQLLVREPILAVQQFVREGQGAFAVRIQVSDYRTAMFKYKSVNLVQFVVGQCTNDRIA